jgi:NADP-dependent 3-hydroxy acid dehydrogenase YdfG
MHAESREVADTGASSGIGAATALLLLEAGAKVAVQARRQEPLGALADVFGAQVGLSAALDREVRPEGIRVTMICPACVHTDSAIGAGCTESDPGLEDYLRPEDVAYAITIVLRQPRRVRTTQWQLLEHGAEQLTPRPPSARAASNGQHRGTAAERPPP